MRVAIEMLATSGYQGMSLEGVAERTDIAKATLYHYFSSKDELVAEALETLTVAVLDRLIAARDAEASGSQSRAATGARARAATRADRRIPRGRLDLLLAEHLARGAR